MALCKWCNSQVTLSEGPLSKPKWQRYFCKVCGAIGYRDEPSYDELRKVYMAAWSDSQNTGKFAAGSTSNIIADSIISVMTNCSYLGLCLDYGGGRGVFAKSLKKKGAIEIYVVEPFGEDIKIQNVIWLSDLNELPPGMTFDWAFMIEVIEHLLNPVGVLERIRQYLKPTGRLVITTPNSKGWRAKIGGVGWRESQNPTHINLFSAMALRLCLHRAGFQKVKRVLKPVRYNAKGLSKIILAATQMFGFDGGLRVIAFPSEGNDKVGR